jgi:hypothetical protein
MKALAALVLGVFFAAGCFTVREKETKVGLDQVPPAVKAAIEKEVAGGTLQEIEMEKCCGGAVYEVEYVRDGRKTEVKFAADGTVMKCCHRGEKSCPRSQKCKPKACQMPRQAPATNAACHPKACQMPCQPPATNAACHQ